MKTEAAAGDRLKLTFCGAGVFVAAAAGLVVEIVAARLIAPYIGMSLYTWTAIIAVVLGGMAAGHWSGGLLAQLPHESSLRRAGILAAAAAAFTGMTPWLIRVLGNGVVALDAPYLVLIALLSLLLFFAPSLLIAVVSPVLAKLAIDLAPGRRGIVIGRMFALGAAGSILGTLLAGFVFISYVGSNGTLLIVAGVMGILALHLLWFSGGRRASAVLLALGVAAGGLIALRPEAVLATACTAESAYYCIRVIDFREETGRPSALMVLDHMGHGINDRDDATLLYSSYVELTDTLVRRRFDGRKKLRSFFIGGGAYTLPRAWAAIYPTGEHLVAEIDPMVTEVAERSMWFRDAGKLRIVHKDARFLLQSFPKQERFDVIVGDAFHDISVPQHLVTREFMAAARARLAPDGLFIMTVIDARHGPRFLASIARTATEVFPVVAIWADTQQLTAGNRLTYLVVAGNRSEPGDRLTSDTFPGRAWVRIPDESITRWWHEFSTPVLTDDLAPVDRLLMDVATTGR
jgi:spermidine synthase